MHQENKEREKIHSKKIVVMIVLKWFLLLALNQLTIGHLLKKADKPVGNQQGQVKV